MTQHKRTPKSEALRELTLNLLELTSAMEARGHEISSPHGQTLSRWKVLTAAECSTHTVSQIARRMGLSRQAVQKIANTLVTDGLAYFENNPDHKTSPYLRLTERGKQIDDAIVQDHIAWSNKFSKSFTLEKLKTTAETLRHLCDKLHEEETEANKGERRG